MSSAVIARPSWPSVQPTPAQQGLVTLQRHKVVSVIVSATYTRPLCVSSMNTLPASYAVDVGSSLAQFENLGAHGRSGMSNGVPNAGIGVGHL